MGNNHGNNVRPSYFKENVNRFGEDFLGRKSAYDLERDASKIIKDVIHGNVDYAKEGKYFYIPSVFQACITKAYNEWCTANYNYMGNCLLMQNGVKDDTLNNVMQYNMRRKDAYAAIWNAFKSFEVTGDLRCLDMLRNQLSKYKQNI